LKKQKWKLAIKRHSTHKRIYPQDRVLTPIGQMIANLGGWKQNIEEEIETGSSPVINNANNHLKLKAYNRVKSHDQL
jgi:hypothetical protein